MKWCKNAAEAQRGLGGAIEESGWRHRESEAEPQWVLGQSRSGFCGEGTARAGAESKWSLGQIASAGILTVCAHTPDA